MTLSAFDDKRRRPQPAALRKELGRSWAAWQALTEQLAEKYAPLEEEWQLPGAKWGWSMRLKHKKRAVVYLTPCQKHFRVGFMLGEKAVRAALGMSLPRNVVKEIQTAKKYAEGRAVRLDIRYKKDLPAVFRLAEAKMAN
jgi:hypothetical protein